MILHSFNVGKIAFRVFLSVISATTLSAMALPRAQHDAPPKIDSPVGDWRGVSTCQVKPSSCHDEDSLYHFKLGTQPGAFEIQADKIVDGKPITMGRGPCKYNDKGQLVCPISGSSATLLFDLKGDEMQGTMKMQDGTTWRKIALKRVPQ